MAVPYWRVIGITTASELKILNIGINIKLIEHRLNK